ncbi:MAG: hypothetical protein UW07_C0004G0019 [Candidatus Nomurabacteria bacterium GW2011_GWF2_43_8]|uniref:Metal-dependent protein hydrolase n=1 Tax=Candidatus Nomurabacteria bacterium GW2011_GWF2_43_8 TaxID=1618779 RepID=A0A0G1FRJ7_9BACT|nr:MAG: hypothetical protein UW07_C0004G0019 [Candidatus Nomurabacteria bacterium GW2011_GWF2_43_8]
MGYLKNFMPKKDKKLVTHDGSFHSDDVFACAALCLLLEKKGEKFKIIRTRDEKIIQTGDYVFDVGGIYDEKTNRFDHHQPGGAGRRDNGIEYSSFGLVCKKFGADICGSEQASELLSKKLVFPIDAFDNGFDLVENKHDVSPYFIQHIFFAMEPTWRENNLDKNKIFLRCVNMAKEILSREMVQSQDTVLAEESIATIYKNTKDKRIIVLDKNYPFEYILYNFPEPLFAIYPRKADNTWGVKAVRNNPKTFINRKNLPKAWAGLRDGELQKITGVEDAIFCHRGLFMAVAKTEKGAVKLAQIAVES